jgi:hypothetical protein
MCGQLHLQPVYLRAKTFGAHWIESWAGPRADLDTLEMGKSSSFAGSRSPDFPAHGLVTIPDNKKNK